MTFSYNLHPDDNTIDEVRFLLQDTDEKTHLIEDEEINYVLGKSDSDVNIACITLCETMAMRYARKQELTVSNYNQKSDTVYKKLLDRAAHFRMNSVQTKHFVCPSISLIDKQINVEDTDLPKASFRRGLMDNPLASQDPGASIEQETETDSNLI